MEAATNPKYDLAISFLSQDEPIAAALCDKLSVGLKVFFYPRNQEELAGTDGLESMRRPFVDDCRVAVVLYRAQWGQTPWTRVEESAIKDGCLKHGWRRLFFMALDDNVSFPKWLPETHVRFNYSSFGIEQAIGAIKGRVQECGGVITPITALTRAQIVHAEAEHKRKRDQLFSSQEWIQHHVRPAVAQTFSEMMRLSAEISSEIGLNIRSKALIGSCSLTNDRVGLSAFWDQMYSNVIGRWKVLEFHNGIILPGKGYYIVGSEPPVMGTHIFLPDLSLGGRLCWVDERNPTEQFSTRDLADRIVQMFLHLCQSADRGEIDTTPEFVKKLQTRRTEEDY